ncbi:MAG: serine hydrolase [Gammaproteobacteria bacterium]|nr:serine hydrolase [Gammaproteobacteria bacterium]
MLKFMKMFVAVILMSSTACWSADSDQSLEINVQKALLVDYKQYKDLEYYSGAALSVYIPKKAIKNFYVGQVSHVPDSEKVSSSTLFEIGSITKSFTAAILLQLEKEQKLHLNDSLKNWLPQYDKWSIVTLDALLNMTSGLPNYSETPLWNVASYQDPSHVFTNEELIQYVYPSTFSPPLKTKYFYTNTGYTLLDLVIEKATHNTFNDELTKRTIHKINLQNTFYPVPAVPAEVEKRLAHGYNYNQYSNPPLVGKDLSQHNLSWAGAAGGIVSNSEDIIRWVKALFVEQDVLDAAQKIKLMQINSVLTGKPIKKLTASDPQGFGLGVAEGLDPEKLFGHYWFYEGETLGFRALYVYTPCNGVIISSVFNSATDNENDHAKLLMKKIYELVLKQYPALQCKSS